MLAGMDLPYGYLVALVLVALGTLSALTAPRRPPALAMLGFRFAVALNELPFAAFAWLLAVTVLTAAQGDLTSPFLIVAAVTTLAGLCLVAWRGRQALPALRHAMGDIPVSRRLPCARILLSPLSRRHGPVERTPDLRYGPAGERNLLDVYRHRSRPTGAPVLIHLHGGRYTGGAKNSQSLPLLYHFAERGWTCVSANYRLRPEADLRDHLVDAKKVIAWIREHGPAHGADPRLIVLAGSSAGAHLASLTALTHDDPAFQPGFEQADTSVTAVVGLGGYYGPYDDAPRSSPSAHARPDAPPFLLIHGSHDTLVPAETARLFADRLRAVSTAPVIYAELPGAHHAFDLFPSLRFAAVINAIEAFAGRLRPSL